MATSNPKNEASGRLLPPCAPDAKLLQPATVNVPATDPRFNQDVIAGFAGSGFLGDRIFYLTFTEGVCTPRIGPISATTKTVYSLAAISGRPIVQPTTQTD
jgi:hypothetical protein